MQLEVKVSMFEKIREVLEMLPESKEKSAIETVVDKRIDKITEIENVFRQVCSKKYSNEEMSYFLNAWKATHLKMLPIYGLSCRLNELSSTNSDKEKKLHLYEASALNAKTSHEDLGIGFEAETHAQLYDDFAYSIVKSDEWKLSKFDVKEANSFQKWVYNNMLLNSVGYALCINMFSEFYNHAEYAYSYETFKYAMQNFYDIQDSELEDALRYIDVHNEFQTEIHHFLAVVNAIKEYEKGSDETVSFDLICEVGFTYMDTIYDAFIGTMEKFR